MNAIAENFVAARERSVECWPCLCVWIVIPVAEVILIAWSLS